MQPETAPSSFGYLQARSGAFGQFRVSKLRSWQMTLWSWQKRLTRGATAPPIPPLAHPARAASPG
eukprot:14895872-Alexandrium_andersonii.AAC.1